jgi:Flp pilus assembly protein TadG
MTISKTRTNRRRRGTEVMEFTLVLLPMIGFLALIVDVAWAVRARSTLQYAVREGVRFAVTGRTLPGSSGQKDSIQTVVETSAMGLLNGKKESIKVRLYKPDTFVEVTGTSGANASPNLVEVSVEDFSLAPLMPVLRSAAPLLFTARSSDRMEAAPPEGTAAW